jgi:hypothetical protein
MMLVYPSERTRIAAQVQAIVTGVVAGTQLQAFDALLVVKGSNAETPRHDAGLWTRLYPDDSW